MHTNEDGSTSAARSADAASRRPTRVWWVNQGSTYDESRSRGVLVAPLHKRDRSPHQPYSDLERAEPGDTILHYAGGAIRATSRVEAAAVVAARPPQIPLYEAWKDPGYLLRAAYRELDQPIERDTIPVEWRTPEAGPFNRYGGVRQAYFFELSRTFVDQLGSMFPALELRAEPHQRQYLMYQWNQEQWMGDQAAGRDGEPLIHAASNAEQFAHLSPGDRLYVVGQWDEKMLLLGRMDVARLMSQDEAEEYFDEPVYEARHHVVADSCTPERFDRIVPEDVARTLTSERGARIAFASESEYRLLTSSLQPRLWLTEESAHALDRLVDVEPQPSGIKLDLVAELENRSRRRRRPNAAQNRAVERQAMSVATRHYEAHGWSVEDVSAAHSFDLLCTRGNALELYVEVKGSSQSWLDEVVLTRNEVALARRWTVDLAVVTGITFGGTSEKPIASGGTLTVFDSFEPSEGQLAPLAYTYTLPSRAQSIDDHA